MNCQHVLDRYVETAAGRVYTCACRDAVGFQNYGRRAAYRPGAKADEARQRLQRALERGGELRQAGRLRREARPAPAGRSAS